MGRHNRNLLIFGAAVAAMVLAIGAVDAVLAQSPFGVGAPKSAPATQYSGGLIGWIMQKQAEYYKGLSAAVRGIKTEWAALWVLLGLSFGYGIFHAAGPGHGKAVISSYVVANRETWWRGVVLSFVSAMVQAAVAVAIVGILNVLLNATAATMRRTTDIVEVASYAFIMAIGARLFCVKGLAFIAAILGRAPTAMEKAVASLIEGLFYVAIIEFVVASLITLLKPSMLVTALAYQIVGAAVLWLLWTAGRNVYQLWKARAANPSVVAGALAPHAQPAHAHAGHAHAGHAHAHHDHVHDHAHHDHARQAHADHGHSDHAHAHHRHDHGSHARDHHHDHSHHDHVHGPDCDHHDHASAWGHAHAPEPSELAGPGGWRRGLSATVAVGLRPCSGAILVLVLAASQGLFWAGALATFVMGLGTAITVAAIAVLSVIATNRAERFAAARSGWGMVFMRGIEVAAAFVITAFGGLLLLGYMASERLPL
jgi:nickel/cobalt exporter